jgi:8-oxo-dGTP pyrophosphatase MutT (NUDIX family)
MTDVLQKITAFITRRRPAIPELLLLEHPYAGIQIPAGTVREGELPEIAARREAQEETGLTGLRLNRYLGAADQVLPEARRAVLRRTIVYARPDRISFDWAYLPRGTRVRVLQQQDQFAQILYEEPDRMPNPQSVTMRIMGWVRTSDLTRRQRRHFYHLVHEGPTDQHWVIRVDHHRFQLFWAALDALPPLVPPQDDWLAYLPADLFAAEQSAT